MAFGSGANSAHKKDEPFERSQKLAKFPCRSCGSLSLLPFVDLGPSPLANSYLTPAMLHQVECFYRLCVYLCRRCFLVQLDSVVPPENIFLDYRYFSSYSDSWLAHARAYADLAMEEFRLSQSSRVIEIGSNDGYLLQYFLEKGVGVLGIDPAANIARVATANGIPTVSRFFGEDLARKLIAAGSGADLLIANNVLAHVPDLNGFVRGLKILLQPQGTLTLEFPYLARLMEENQFDTIYHEHLSYFSFTAVNRVLKRHGLAVFDVEELPTHGGSLRVYAGHWEDRSKPMRLRVKTMLAAEKNLGLHTVTPYLAFAERVKGVKRKLLKWLIRTKEEGKSVVAYGAPAKGNTLLNYCGIRTDFIDYAVDRSPHKQGLFLPGTRIPIYPPERIAQTRPDCVLILPWNLKSEITRQLPYIRQWSGKFLVPIPQVRCLE
ncbi:MAG TPA: class I SAM-dependent methyltransferase [Candidatus Binatia bacterium]|nr:class I SAM-dependent methyltransferase [Candidatus Binatia bacterium]